MVLRCMVRVLAVHGLLHQLKSACCLCRFQAFVVSQEVKALLRPEDFSRLSVQAAEHQKLEQVKQEEASKEAQAAAASAAAAAAGEGAAGQS